MARFDVRTNLSRASRAKVPYLLELQADMLGALGTRLVIPLTPASAFGPPAKRLNPVFRVGRQNYVMGTAQMAAISANLLGKRVTSLSEHAAEILGAVDFLISGI